jgi:hypothetical protein
MWLMQSVGLALAGLLLVGFYLLLLRTRDRRGALLRCLGS